MSVRLHTLRTRPRPREAAGAAFRRVNPSHREETARDYYRTRAPLEHTREYRMASGSET
jgi:hypothetical protein